MTQRSTPSRRGRRPAEEAERKDRIIQTRVPKDLEATLKEAAERERVSVSHLIRNVLEDTFHLVDNIVADSAQLVDSVRRDALKLAASARGDKPRGAVETTADSGDPLQQVEAWQDVIVNKPCQCQHCGTALARGNHAFRGLGTTPSQPSVWLCPDCLAAL
jgi:hypothetical protein